jgi:hypothetical protein
MPEGSIFMDHPPATVTARIEAICDELGLNPSIAQRLAVDVLAPELEAARQQIGELAEENRRLKETQAEIASLLNAKSPEKLLHDLRNVLNELVLLKAVAEDQ